MTLKQYIGLGASLLLMASCSGNEKMESPSLQPEATPYPIRCSVSQSVHNNQTRVQLFDPNNDENFFDQNCGGGEFSVTAYFEGTVQSTQEYFKDARVWYRAEDKEWINLNDEGSITDHYWTKEGALNFFAYMPGKKYQEENPTKKTYVTLGGYTHATGQQFSCDLPANNDDNANMIEFIYAYTPNQTFTNAIAGSDGVKRTPLKFVHPFSLICFQLGSSSIRMTVESIKLSNVHLKGDFFTGQTSTVDGIGSWTPTEATGSTYTATIELRIPNDVNYNTVFGGPYVMMPQDLTNVSLTIEYKRKKTESESTDTDSGSTDADSGSTSAESESTDETTEVRTLTSLATTNIPKWEPGKRYTYTLMHGDNNEEIYFNVEVADWIYVDYRNEIDVE